jgi:hypothetical protein
MNMTSSTRSPLLRAAGLISFWGALLGAVGGIALIVAPPAVPPDRFSYPFDVGGFLLAESAFAVNHVLLLVGVLGLAGSGAAGTVRFSRSGPAIAAVGWAALAACELGAMTFATARYPSPETGVLDTCYGVSTILIGVGLVLTGIAVVRARVWTGWARYAPLACGVAVFVLVIPAVFGPFLVGRLVLTGWMLMLAGLGRALHTATRRPAGASVSATA